MATERNCFSIWVQGRERQNYSHFRARNFKIKPDNRGGIKINNSESRYRYEIIAIIAIILIVVTGLIISLNLFGPGEEGTTTLVSGPGDTSISVPPSVAASGATFTIQQLDPATAPELPEWADNVISLYDFSVDRPIQDSVTIRIPIPDVELAVLGHYYEGNWEAMFFEEEDGKAVVEVENLSLFSWLDVKVSDLSDKIQDFFTLRWMEEKPSLSSDLRMDVDESGALGLISGCAQFINENEVELLVYNNAPVHLEVYPTEYPSGKVVELKQTGIYAGGDRAIIAPRDSAEWTVQLAPEESVIFEAYFSDSAVVSLTGDLIPYGRFARGLVESSLFARNGRRMGWGDIKGLLIIPAIAEASLTIEEIGEMPILETVRITFTRILTREVTATITNLGVSTSGFTIYEPGERLSDSRAGDPSYVYLVIGQGGVRLAGPQISSPVGIYLESEQITKVGHGYFDEYWNEGYEVKVNPHLMYTVEIGDFEDEIDLALVELSKEGNTIKSSFIFVATSGGVAHDVTISAVVDGTKVGSSTPISIESR